MSSYTPGPWHADGQHVIAPGHFAAYVRGVRFDAKGDFGANARLMAAAPDLAEALQLIVQWDGEGLALCEHHIARARAALAKAGVCAA